MAASALSAFAVANLRGRRRLRKPPRIAFPTNAARDYLRGLLRVLEQTQDAIERHVLQELPRLVAESGVRRDDFTDDIERAFGAVRTELDQTFPPRGVENLVATVGQTVNRHNRAQVSNQVRTVLGVEPPTGEAWLFGTMRGWERENVTLASSVPRVYVDQVEQRVWRGLREGKTAPELREDAKGEYTKARNRAAFTAADQTGTLNGQLTGRRHSNLGITRYRWRNARDERVRGRPDGKWARSKHSHWHREGVIFEESDPPEDGHPGVPPRCRCWREPVFEDILGAEFAVDQTPAPIASRALQLPRAAARGAGSSPHPGAGGAPPEKPKPRAGVKDRYGRWYAFSERQAEADRNARWLRGSAAAREIATFHERRDWIVWEWVHGSESGTSLLVKEAARAVFRGTAGLGVSSKGQSLDHGIREVRRMAQDLLAIHRATQRQFRAAGIRSVRLYRGTKNRRGDALSRDPLVIESWSTDISVARKFAGPSGVVETQDIPVERILMTRNSKGWVDGRHGDQGEVLVLGTPRASLANQRPRR